MIILIITVFRLVGVTSRGPGNSTHGETLGKRITRSLLRDGQDTLAARPWSDNMRAGGYRQLEW